MTQPGAELVERARGLTALLAKHAAEAEQLRQPHDAVIAALETSGIFELMVPRCYGGRELDLDTYVEVGLALAEGDASMSWVATFYIEHNWMLCQFPETFQRELFANRSYVLAPGSVSMGGVAEPSEAGFRLKGRWGWATGVVHSDWVLVGGRVNREDEAVDLRLFALPKSEVEVPDTWYVDGMCGTGSHDIVIHDQFVPEERSVSFLEMLSGAAPGSKLHEGPLYRTPMIPILALAASMPAVGQARAAVHGFRERMQERVLYGTTTRQSEKATAQVRLARAEIEAREAEDLLRKVAANVMELRERATPEDRNRWVASLAYAVDRSKRVIGSIAEASGASAHLLTHALQRAKRDVDTLSSHTIFDLDGRLESYGRVLLGLEPNGPF